MSGDYALKMEVLPVPLCKSRSNANKLVNGDRTVQLKRKNDVLIEHRFDSTFQKGAAMVTCLHTRGLSFEPDMYKMRRSYELDAHYATSINT